MATGNLPKLSKFLVKHTGNGEGSQGLWIQHRQDPKSGIYSEITATGPLEFAWSAERKVH